MKKRLITVILTLAMLTALFPAAMAAGRSPWTRTCTPPKSR